MVRANKLRKYPVGLNLDVVECALVGVLNGAAASGTAAILATRCRINRR
jgi:hypothetical protein